MSDDILLSDLSNPAIAVFTLNRPHKRNAMSIELTEALADAVASAANDPQCRVLVLRGNGPAFCAGLDLKEAEDENSSSRSGRALARLYLALADSPLITIAAPQGAAFGGGAGIVAACDLAIAADDLRLGFPEVHRGLVAGLVTALLCRQLGDKDVRSLVLLGQTIDAARAKSLGLIHSAVPLAQHPQATIGLASQAAQGAPGAIARTKHLLNDLSPRPLKADIDRALQDHLAARNSAEAREGIAAFLAHRKPVWPLSPSASSDTVGQGER